MLEFLKLMYVHSYIVYCNRSKFKVVPNLFARVFMRVLICLLYKIYTLRKIFLTTSSLVSALTTCTIVIGDINSIN